MHDTRVTFVNGAAVTLRDRADHVSIAALLIKNGFFSSNRLAYGELTPFTIMKHAVVALFPATDEDE